MDSTTRICDQCPSPLTCHSGHPPRVDVVFTRVPVPRYNPTMRAAPNPRYIVEG